MAIVRVTGGGGLERRVGLKAAAKKGAKKGANKGAKHAIEKHAAKKGALVKHPGKKAAKEAAKKAAKKAAENHAGLTNESKPKKESDAARLERAFHHLQRAVAVVSLVEADAGGDLRLLLAEGIELYRRAAKTGAKVELTRQAAGMLKALEHLGMAGLYSARIEFRVEVPEPAAVETEERLRRLRPRLEKLVTPDGDQAERVMGLAWELLRRADAAGDDLHLEYELGMAADGLVTALEEGY